jgi:hypothetical protein
MRGGKGKGGKANLAATEKKQSESMAWTREPSVPYNITYNDITFHALCHEAKLCK